jgi:hypothetical protein
MNTWPPTGTPVVRPAKIPEGHWDVVIGNVSSPFATRERAEEVAEIVSQSENPCLDMWHLYMLDQMPDSIMGAVDTGTEV